MNGKMDMEQLIVKCWELETTVHLWSEANDAKAQRIQELENECNRLRQRVCRLSRMVGRRSRSSQARRVRC